MGSTYSVYEAKAKFSEVLRKVQRGQRVTITNRGKEVAEIRPAGKKTQSVEERFKELQDLGIITPASRPFSGFKPVAKRPGGLARFLAERE